LSRKKKVNEETGNRILDRPTSSWEGWMDERGSDEGGAENGRESRQRGEGNNTNTLTFFFEINTVFILINIIKINKKKLTIKRVSIFSTKL